MSPFATAGVNSSTVSNLKYVSKQLDSAVGSPLSNAVQLLGKGLVMTGKAVGQASKLFGFVSRATVSLGQLLGRALTSVGDALVGLSKPGIRQDVNPRDPRNNRDSGVAAKVLVEFKSTDGGEGFTPQAVPTTPSPQRMEGIPASDAKQLSEGSLPESLDRAEARKTLRRGGVPIDFSNQQVEDSLAKAEQSEARLAKLNAKASLVSVDTEKSVQKKGKQPKNVVYEDVDDVTVYDPKKSVVEGMQSAYQKRMRD